MHTDEQTPDEAERPTEGLAKGRAERLGQGTSSPAHFAARFRALLAEATAAGVGLIAHGSGDTRKVGAP